MVSITTIKDVGHKVLIKNDDETPKQVLKCFIKEGQYGKFFSLEKHWVQNIDGDKMETNWARWSITLPYDKEGALKLVDYMKELMSEAVEAEFEDE